MPAERGTVGTRTEGAPDGSTEKMMKEPSAEGKMIPAGQASGHDGKRAEAPALASLQRRPPVAGPLLASSVRLPLDRLSLRLALLQLAILVLGLALMALLVILLFHLKSSNIPFIIFCTYILLVLL
ncbi:MAG: hypothetical protein IRZ24_17510, partial [Thermogemmatispora sp.]